MGYLYYLMVLIDVLKSSHLHFLLYVALLFNITIVMNRFFNAVA